jgi:HSP20 family molecular chaperone IbpA
MIRELGESLGNTVVETVGRAVGRAQESRPLPVDLLESDEAYLAVFDAPGATASDVQVRFEDREVRVRVDRFREFHEGFEMRFPGRGMSLDGRVSLPEDAAVDPAGATATLTDNGTLQVRIPRAAGGAAADSAVAVDEADDAGDGEDSGAGDAHDDRDSASAGGAETEIETREERAEEHDAGEGEDGSDER